MIFDDTIQEKVTRRDRFLEEIEAITHWPALLAQIEPFYPKGVGRCVAVAREAKVGVVFPY